MGSMSQRQWIAIALFGVAVICFFIFVFTANIFVSGNRVAMLAIAVGGTSTTIAAWLWAGRRAA